MPTVAQLLNAPTEIEFEGKSYRLREPTLLECGQYEKWLEQEARAGAARAVELSDEDRRNLLRDVAADIGAQRYCWGGELAARSLLTPPGMAKLLRIICADQGVTEVIARKMADKRLLDIFAAVMGELEVDPTGKTLGEHLKSVALPQNFFSSSSSASPTLPTTGTSERSEASASAS